MKKVIVLGSGMVGRAMAIDLSKKYDITVADINEGALQYPAKNNNIKTLKADLSDTNKVRSIIKEYDLVLSAVPGFMGFQTLKAVIESGKNVVDISFLPEDHLKLNDTAVKNNVTAIVDCGVAPGVPNILLGYYNEKMKVTDFEYIVGGLPKERNFPFEYKAPFSPVDVIEEYTRPARMLQNGVLTVKPAMSETELINFAGIGDLEAFNTDGLRSLLFTMKHIPNMKEKTLRYPGHIRLIQALKASGFLEESAIEYKGNNISPLDFTSKILFKKWKLLPNEEEFTVMKIKITGFENGKQPQQKKEIIYDLYDEFNKETQTSSMARTTGYTATAAVDMILSNKFNHKGVFPPEFIGKYPECFEHIMKYLQERNVKYIKLENLLILQS